MDVREFKAWFEGFTEGIKGVPTKEQWQRIKNRIKEVDGSVLTREVFVQKYVEPFRPWWEVNRPYLTCSTTSARGIPMTHPQQEEFFLSTEAMHDLGKCEFSMSVSAANGKG